MTAALEEMLSADMMRLIREDSSLADDVEAMLRV